jgi:hypothetical protein
MAPLNADSFQDENTRGLKKPPSWRPTRSVCGDMLDRQFQQLQKEIGPHKYGAHRRALGRFCRKAYVQGRIAEVEQMEAQKKLNAFFEKGPVKRRTVAEACRPASGHPAHWKAFDSVARCFERHVPPIEATDSDVRFQEHCEKTGRHQAKPRPQSAPIARTFRLNCPYYPEKRKEQGTGQTIERLLDAGWSGDSHASSQGNSVRQRPASALGSVGRLGELHEMNERGWMPPSMPFGMSNVASAPALPAHAQAVIEDRKEMPQCAKGPPAGAPGKGLVLELRLHEHQRRQTFRGRRRSTKAISPCPPTPQIEGLD